MMRDDLRRSVEARPEADSGAADVMLTSYRYLRIGMFGLVALLGVSVLIERSKIDCWQTSISAYYYTPVRAIFVAGLVAIGFALIVVKGRSSAQDILLNLAGMMAPVVAMVPISSVGSCFSVEPGPSPVGEDGTTAGWVMANIDNNIQALIATGMFGLATAAVLAYVKLKRDTSGRRRWPLGSRIGLLSAFGLILAALVAYRVDREWFRATAHYIAAFSMFIALGIVVGIDAWARLHSRAHDDFDQRSPAAVRNFGLVYAAIAGLMVVAAVVFLVGLAGWDYKTLGLEIAEIALFAAYWVFQTIELWDRTPEGRPLPAT